MPRVSVAYINRAQAPARLQREFPYQMLGQRQRFDAYRAFVASGGDEELLQFYAKGNNATVIGDKEFREAIAEDKEAGREESASGA